jgi:hypothetical protein
MPEDLIGTEECFAIVNESMVIATGGHEIREIGLAAIAPGFHVMNIDHFIGAARKPASAVSFIQRKPQFCRNPPRLSADIDGVAILIVHDFGRDRIAAHLAQALCGNSHFVAEPPFDGAALECRIGMHDDMMPLAALLLCCPEGSLRDCHERIRETLSFLSSDFEGFHEHHALFGPELRRHHANGSNL